MKARLFAALALALPTLASAESLIICRLTKRANPVSIARRYGMTLRDTTPAAPFALFGVKSDEEGDVLEARLRADTANIVWAEDDGDLGSPEDEAHGQAPSKGGGLPAVGGRSQLQDINANLLGQISWSKTLAETPGRQVRLAILDTGLSTRQAALWSKVDASVNCVEKGQVADDVARGTDSNGNGVPDEGTGHGTMIAGIVDQIAPNVHLVIARVADSDGRATGWRVIKGLAFASVEGAEVANVSLGTLARVPALSDVLDWCEERRMLVVAAIGNDAQGAACYPARISKAVCVAGVDADSHKASFSNWDSTSDAAAPATGIASQFWDGELAVWSGTSFACPMVAASLADALRLSSPSTPDALRKALKATSASLDSLNPNYKGKLGGLLDYTRLIGYFHSP